MTRNEFLSQLEKKISHLPKAEREKSLSFYEESIDDRMEDGMSEAAAVSNLGELDDIAHEIELALPLPMLVKTKLKNDRKNSENQTLWFVLAICGSPLWIPILLAGLGIAFSIYAVIWSGIVCLYALLVSLAAMGSCGLIGGVVHMFAHPLSGIALFGIALLSAGLFLLCAKPILSLTKKLLAATVWFGKKIKTVFISKKGVV
ncbi:MAG: DUF1700 domain-containing protein [Evtepia sp.]